MITTAFVLCFSLNIIHLPTDSADSSEAGAQRTSLILKSDSTASLTPPEENPKNLIMQEKGTSQETPVPGTQHLPQFGSSSRPSAAAVESLMVAHPSMRRTILKELLTPTGPPPYLASTVRRARSPPSNRLSCENDPVSGNGIDCKALSGVLRQSNREEDETAAGGYLRDHQMVGPTVQMIQVLIIGTR